MRTRTSMHVRTNSCLACVPPLMHAHTSMHGENHSPPCMCSCPIMHADKDIERLPKRRTDGARVADIAKYKVKLYTKDGGMKLIKRCGPASAWRRQCMCAWGSCAGGGACKRAFAKSALLWQAAERAATRLRDTAAIWAA